MPEHPQYSKQHATQLLREAIMDVMHQADVGERLTSFAVYARVLIDHAEYRHAESKVNSNLAALAKLGYVKDAGPRGSHGGHQWYIPTVSVPIRMDRLILEEWLEDNPEAAIDVPVWGSDG